MRARIESTADLRPGDFGFGPIDGWAGILSRLGHLALGEAVQLQRSRVDHVFVVTDAQKALYLPSSMVTDQDAMCVEAMPRGARHVSIEDRWTDRYAYIRLPLESTPAGAIAEQAKALIGTPYSFLDWLALAARHRHLDPMASSALNKAIRRRVTDSGHMVCSQLADQALTRAGVQVFADGRLSQDVTPGALFYRLIALGGQLYFPGERLL